MTGLSNVHQPLEANMCSTPTIPTVPVRQPTQLPDQGAVPGAANPEAWQRTVLAGMMTGPQGVLGSPTVSNPTLG
jgi:hypothetical protein